MHQARLATPEDPVPVPLLPDWAAVLPARTVEEAAFASGVAFAHLHLVAAHPSLPCALWRERLALSAAVRCGGLAGRQDSEATLRDAVRLTRPGDHPGPAGAVLLSWLRAVARPVSVGQLAKALGTVSPTQIALSLDAQGATPVDRAAVVIEAVLTDAPRSEGAALVLADAVLSRGTGRDHLLPLLSVGIRPRDMRLRGDDLRLACHRAVVAGASQAVPLAADLARRAARLRAVVPGLRAKMAVQAVDLFLTRDALAPAALMPLMSDRAARRLCDRLVDFGALRELTGRDSFRLYGV